MRFVQRSDEVPEDFEGRARDEFDDVLAHRNDPTKTKSFTFKTYKRPEIKQLLTGHVPRQMRLLRDLLFRLPADGCRTLPSQGRGIRGLTTMMATGGWR